MAAPHKVVKTRSFGGGPISGVVTYTAVWNGDVILDIFHREAEKALRKTCQLAVRLAKQYVRVDTGRLQRSIRVLSVVPRGNSFYGTFGTFVPYAIWQEIGTRFHSGTHYILRGAQEAAPFFWVYFRLAVGKRYSV